MSMTTITNSNETKTAIDMLWGSVHGGWKTRWFGCFTRNYAGYKKPTGCRDTS